MSDFGGLIDKPQKPDYLTCRRKVSYYSIWPAIERWGEIIDEEGWKASFGVYICGGHYHLGTKKLSKHSARKTLCIWCGNTIKPARKFKHMAKCNWRMNLE